MRSGPIWRLTTLEGAKMAAKMTGKGGRAMGTFREGNNGGGEMRCLLQSLLM